MFFPFNLNLKLIGVFVVLGCSCLFAQFPDIVINEFMASNQSINQDPDFAEFSDWLELYNTTDAEIDISGYYLTDNMDDRTKWQFPVMTIIPSHSYLLVWADNEDTELHTNFKISKNGEELALSDPEINTIDSIRFGGQEDDISFGRNPLNLSEWAYYSPPSPGSENNSANTIDITPQPQFSQDGGFYSGSQVVSFINASSLDIYYTIDGTRPDNSSTPYSNPININETTPVRAIAYQVGNPPSAIITHTYFIDIPVNLPVISIVTDPANFFDDEIGIYVTGVNGTGGYCAGVVGNVNQDWERPVNLELYEMDGEAGLNQRAGIKIFGGCSRHRFPQKSLALYARSDYGDGSFSHRLFEEKDIDKFETFVLRSAADDQVKTMFRDAGAQQMLVGSMNSDYQAYQPVVVYLNGDYWGIHNIREKLNEHYFEGNFAVNPDEVNILANGGSNWSIHHGSNEDYLSLMDFVTSQDLSDDTNYEMVQDMMDIDQYIDYMIGHMYQAESDWPGNNIKFWKANTGEYSRWRWINFDMDGSLNSYRVAVNMIDKCTTTTGPSWPNPEWSTRLFRNLLENLEFRHKYLNRYSWHMSTTFDSTRIISIVDSLADRLRPEMPAHIGRWGGQVDPVGSAAESWIPATFDSMELWESNVNEMRIFARERQAYTVQNLVNHFSLSGASHVGIQINIPGSGVVMIDNHRVHSGFAGRYFNEIPVSLNATPIQGYRFSHWEAQIEAVEDLQIVSTGSEWKYHDLGANLGTGWRQPSFNDEPWSTGLAQLGYGDGDEATVVDYGGDPSNKHITTYFRKSFSMNGTSDYQDYSLSLLVDDGAVVYLNGNELARVNMPGGLIYYSTTASSPIADESAFHQISIPSTLIYEGNNILAIEVQQASPTSSDISFDCSLTGHSNTTGESFTIDTPETEIAFSGDITLTANFELENNPMEAVVVISEINYRSAENHDTEDWVELYNGSDVYVDMSSWSFMDASNDTFLFPNGYLFEPESYLIIARDSESFRAFHPSLECVVGEFNFGLSSAGEYIKLVNSESELIDEVEFGIATPWPVSANGTGYTIELIDLTSDNMIGGNWIADRLYGTPGQAYNSVTGVQSFDQLSYSLYQNYPNPFNPTTTIRYTLAGDTFVKLTIHDILGREIIVLQNSEKPGGTHELSWNGMMANGLPVATGLYFCRIEAGDYHKTIKMAYLR